jgi:hypothetical protein
MIRTIKSIKSAEPYILELEFNTGEIRKINLKKKLLIWSQSEGSIYKSLLDEKYFCNVKLNSELETIYWDNGIDFCPDMLYSMGE